MSGWTSAACRSNSKTLNAPSASTRSSPPPILPSGSLLLAQLCAARICLKRLNRPQDALRFYEAAAASAVPHLDLELDIQSGIREARIAITQVKAFSAGASCGN